jgi:hypothetical protein
MSLLAAFNGEVPEPGKGVVCKTTALGHDPVRGSNPFLSAKPFERSGLTCFKFILSRLIPVGGFA